MKDAIFFLNPGENRLDLAEVAERVFRLLGVREWEERFSSNYPPDEHYFAGYAENANVTVYDRDDERMPDFPICVSVDNSTWRKGTGTIITDPPKMAKMLAAGEFAIFVPNGAWYQPDWDGDGDVYAANALQPPTK